MRTENRPGAQASPRIIIPKYAPIYCAFGMLDVDLIHDFTRFYQADKSNFDFDKLKALYKDMEKRGLPCVG